MKMILALLLVLAGCGGGGDSQEPDQTTNPPNCKESPSTCV